MNNKPITVDTINEKENAKNNMLVNEKPTVPNMEVKAVEMVDIYDKVQKYIVMIKGSKKCIINVGDKTFNTIKEMTK